MVICLSALLLSSVLSLVIRQMLVRDNRALDRALEADLQGANLERVKEAARLEGISFDEALQRRRGFRFLY